MRNMLLATVVAFGVTPARAETMIVAVPARLSADAQTEVSEFFGKTFQSLQPKDKLIVFDASRLRIVATLNMPDQIGTGKRARIKALGPAAGQIMDFITGADADAVADGLNIPSTLREIGATILPTVKDAKVLLVGSAFYEDRRNADFSTRDFVPSDGFLLEKTRGVFSVAGQENTLKGALVSICYTDPSSAFVSEQFRQMTVDFWGKSIVGRGGKVGSIQQYSSACAERLRSDVVDPAQYKINHKEKLYLIKQHWRKVEVR